MRYFRKLEIASLHLYLSKMGLIKLWSLCFSIFKRPRSPLHPPSHSPLRGTCRCGARCFAVSRCRVWQWCTKATSSCWRFCRKSWGRHILKAGTIYTCTVYIHIRICLYIYIYTCICITYIYRYRCNIWNFYCTYIFVYSLNKNAVQPLLYGGLLQPFSLLSCLLTAFDQNPAN